MKHQTYSSLAIVSPGFRRTLLQAITPQNNSLLLIHILRSLSLRTSRNLLIRQIPVVQMSHSSSQISRESQPSQVWSKSPPSNGINLSPYICQVADCACESDDVDESFDGALGDKEEGHPDEIEAQLDGVEGGTLLGEEVGGRGGHGVHAGGVGAVGGVAH